jgi:DNA-binding response OmpR family regulator
MAERDKEPGGTGKDRRPLRVLVVEDEFLVALSLEEDLRALGCVIVGPYTTLADATAAAGRERFDLAILDVNLNGEMAYPLFDEMIARRAPTLLLSGYGKSSLPARFRDLPQIEKPYDPRALARSIRLLASEHQPDAE